MNKLRKGGIPATPLTVAAVVATIVMLATLAGCGDRATDPAADATASRPAAVQAGAAGPPDGEALYLVCQGCHPIEAGAPHGVGPNLHGLVGQRAGTRPGYTYSETLASWGVTWTPDMLHGFIMNSESMVPGTWMAYRNILTPEETARLVEYIVEAAGAPATGAAALSE